MMFRYSTKIGYFLAVCSFCLPFMVSVQYFTFEGLESSTVIILGPFWQIIADMSQNVSAPPMFNISPLPLLIWFPFWAPGLYISKLAYDTAKKQDIGLYDYRFKTGIALVVHSILLLLFALGSGGYPEPLEVPLPIVGVLALLLSGYTVHEPEKPWDVDDSRDAPDELLHEK